jgi:hypothetical protein
MVSQTLPREKDEHEVYQTNTERTSLYMGIALVKHRVRKNVERKIQNRPDKLFSFEQPVALVIVLLGSGIWVTVLKRRRSAGRVQRHVGISHFRW